MKNLTTYSEFLNEYTSYNFEVPKLPKLDPGAKKEIGGNIPHAIKTMDAAEKRIKSYAGKQMFTHVGYIEWKDEGLRYHWKQYWLKDEKVKVSLLTVSQDDEVIGRLFVDTTALLTKDIAYLKRHLGKFKSA